ncbi:MAG: polyphosphate kinase 2 family protein [Gemmataceae bacterium]
MPKDDDNVIPKMKPGKAVSLDDYDPSDTGSYKSAEEAKETLQAHIDELIKLQNLLYAGNRHSLLIILQGMDTSGKDGTIRHVMSGLSPLGVQVHAFKAPSPEELAHDFLWRVHKVVPPRGYIGIFNRSQYEDVLVVRVHELVKRRVWKDRYKQINHFERLLTKNDTIILKFFLHISKDEQKKRLADRLSDPTRYWKFSLQDIEERKLWSDYQKAYEDVLSLCSTKHAPWYIVPANHKWYRNLVVAGTIVKTLRELKMEYPPAMADLSKVVID